MVSPLFGGYFYFALFYRFTRKQVYELLETYLVIHNISLQLILNILFDCPFILSNCTHIISP